MHFRSPSLSLTVQLMHLRRLHPDGRGEVRRDRLFWQQDIRPHALAHRYRCRLEHTLGDYPLMYCIDPPLSALAEGRRLPHVRTRTEPIALCLFVYGPKCWHGQMLLGDVVVPLAFYWLAHFEEWLFTGVWRGGGTHEIEPDTPAAPPLFPGDLNGTPPDIAPPSAPSLPTLNQLPHAHPFH